MAPEEIRNKVYQWFIDRGWPESMAKRESEVYLDIEEFLHFFEKDISVVTDDDINEHCEMSISFD